MSVKLFFKEVTLRLPDKAGANNTACRCNLETLLVFADQFLKK